MDKRALLDELKIDRGAAAEEPPRRPLRWFALIAAIAGIAFIAWYVVFPKSEPVAVAAPVVPATAAPAPRSAAVEGSVLDATGYVVARRQATVSAKTIGKVVEVFIEEGMRVEEGQLLARLDVQHSSRRTRAVRIRSLRRPHAASTK